MALSSSRPTVRRLLDRGLNQTIGRFAPCLYQSQTFASAASAEATAEPIPDLESESSLNFEEPSRATISRFNPLKQALRRQRLYHRELPPSRYKFRPPRYYRGPLHPHQPPRPSDISSREFIPGPFSYPRLEQTYHSTIATDLMVLKYKHVVPGTPEKKASDRNRPWVGDSPYFKNRPAKGPPGGVSLLPLYRPVTWQNVPQLRKITLHAYSEMASEDPAYMHVASIAVQSVTNVRAKLHERTAHNKQVGRKLTKTVAVSADLEGEDMYHFLGKCIELVLPRVKEWKGIPGSSGDRMGNIAFGLKPADFALFPEIEFNYDMYPSTHIPGCHIQIQTTATSDEDARLLLMGLGLPFHGKLKS